MTQAAVSITRALGKTPGSAFEELSDTRLASDLGRRPQRLATDEIGEIPYIVASVDARQAEARIDIWRTGNPGFDAQLRLNVLPASALRRLAIGRWSAGDARSASIMLATAASMAPETAEIWLDLGFTLQGVGQKRDAKLAIERSVALDPAPARAWLGLATLANELGDKALAERAFAAAFERDSSLSGAAFGLGLIAFEQRRYAEAVERFRAAVAAGCDNGLVWVGLGQSLFFLGDFAGAARESQRWIAGGAPDPALIRRCALARYLELAQTGDFAAAERAYAEIAGSHAEENRALAKSAFQILSAYGHREAALKLAEARLDRGAGDSVLRYLVDAVAGEPLERAPKDYLIAYFDHFADRFDEQLVEVLGYNVPGQLTEMIGAAGRSLKRAVDLGCGTGLAGQLLRPECSRLVGVDLSKRMLAKSAARGVYDELVEADVTMFLRETRERFDLVVAADTLVYFGALQSFFAAAARATTVGAILAFNIETTTGTPFRILPSGRFAHDLSALPQMAAPWFTMLTNRISSPRAEASSKVDGALVLMERRGVRPRAFSLANRIAEGVSEAS